MRDKTNKRRGEIVRQEEIGRQRHTRVRDRQKEKRRQRQTGERVREIDRRQEETKIDKRRQEEIDTGWIKWVDRYKGHKCRKKTDRKRQGEIETGG